MFVNVRMAGLCLRRLISVLFAYYCAGDVLGLCIHVSWYGKVGQYRISSLTNVSLCHGAVHVLSYVFVGETQRVLYIGGVFQQINSVQFNSVGYFLDQAGGGVVSGCMLSCLLYLCVASTDVCLLKAERMQNPFTVTKVINVECVLRCSATIDLHLLQYKPLGQGVAGGGQRILALSATSNGSLVR